jgi:hypothetical protein
MKYDEAIFHLISNLTQMAIVLIYFNFIIKKDDQVILSPKNLEYSIKNFDRHVMNFQAQLTIINRYYFLFYLF